MSRSTERVEIRRTEDAMREAVVILGSQLGSDGTDLSEMRVDPRRFSRVNLMEVVALAYFDNHENDWVQDFGESYLNLKMSIEGHERSKLIVEAIKGIGGSRVASKKKVDDRNWHQRNLTQRNKEPEDDEV